MCQLIPMVGRACNEPDLQALKERDIDGYVALGREGGTAPAVDAD